MEVVFILVEPGVPRNVGGAARALKTMGFQHLRIINSNVHNHEEAKWLAHGSLEILENAENVPSLNEAIQDIDFLIGTTAKARSSKKEYYSPAEVGDILRGKTNSLHKVGILFGKEESGLNNEDLQKCDIASTIPLKTVFPSLNLAQSVMLYAYELSKENLQSKVTNISKGRIYPTVKSKLVESFNRTTIKNNPVLFNRILERLSVMGDDDLKLILSVIEKFDNK